MSTQRMVKKMRARLTLDNNILTGFFVTLTLAADTVRKTVTLVSEGLTLLTCWDAHHQMILNTKDQ